MKIYLIHNPLSWQPLYWFSFIIRVATANRYNHAAIEFKGQIWEAAASGIISTDKLSWLKKTKRYILPLAVDLEAFGLTEQDIAERLEYADPYQYGYLDILKIFWYDIVKYRWFGSNKRWNGEAKLQGMFCFEFVAWLLGLANAHTYLQVELLALNGIKVGQEFETEGENKLSSAI